MQFTDDILYEIFQFLSLAEVSALRRTNKRHSSLPFTSKDVAGQTIFQSSNFRRPTAVLRVFEMAPLETLIIDSEVDYGVLIGALQSCKQLQHVEIRVSATKKSYETKMMDLLPDLPDLRKLVLAIHVANIEPLSKLQRLETLVLEIVDPCAISIENLVQVMRVVPNVEATISQGSSDGEMCTFETPEGLLPGMLSTRHVPIGFGYHSIYAISIFGNIDITLFPKEKPDFTLHSKIIEVVDLDGTEVTGIDVSGKEVLSQVPESVLPHISQFDKKKTIEERFAAGIAVYAIVWQFETKNQSMGSTIVLQVDEPKYWQ